MVAAAITLTEGQKTAAKIASKVLITAGTAVAASSIQEYMLDKSAKKLAAKVNDQIENVDKITEENLIKVQNGEMTPEEANAQAQAATDAVYGEKEMNSYQKKARKKSRLVCAGVAGIGAAAAIGVDCLIDALF